MNASPRPPYRRVIFLCVNERAPGEDACGNRGSAALQKELKEYVKANRLQDRIRICRTLCFALCAEGPNLAIQPDNVWLKGVQREDLPEIIRKWIDPLKDER